MPVRSLNSRVLKWPRRDEVKKALQSWLEEQVAAHPELIQLGYFGSLAKDCFGVGSDLDLIVIIKDSSLSFEERTITWDFDALPVPTDILLYTEEEWQVMQEKGGRFVKMIENEAVWLYGQIQ